jgi:hypothetical protein
MHRQELHYFVFLGKLFYPPRLIEAFTIDSADIGNDDECGGIHTGH